MKLHVVKTPVPFIREWISFLYFWKGKVTHPGWISGLFYSVYIYLLWKFNARESTTRWSLRNRSLLLSSFSPLSFWSTKNFDHYISSFPSPFSRGKIIHEEQKRVLIYLQIEQEHCFERETSQSVKIIKPIRMDQPESKGNYRSNHRTNKSRSTVMASGILSITYFLSVSETAFSD